METEKTNDKPLEAPKEIDLSTPDPNLGSKLAGLEGLTMAAGQSGEDQRKLFEPGSAKPKNKGGRPRKDGKPAGSGKTDSTGPNPGAQNTQPPPGAAFVSGFDSSLAMEQVFAVLSGALVRATKCPEAALSVEETKALGQTWGAVANQYLPALMAQHGPLLMAVTVTGAVGIRVAAVLDMELKRRQQAWAASQGGAQPGNPKPAPASDPFPNLSGVGGDA